MDQKELKKVIKQLVRESLTEIFCEMKLENIVENVIKRTGSVSAPTATPRLPQKISETLLETEQPESQEDLRAKITKMVAADESEWADIYKDTVENGHPVIDGEEGGSELVSEAVLKKHGLLKDYSKFVK